MRVSLLFHTAWFCRGLTSRHVRVAVAVEGVLTQWQQGEGRGMEFLVACLKNPKQPFAKGPRPPLSTAMAVSGPTARPRRVAGPREGSTPLPAMGCLSSVWGGIGLSAYASSSSFPVARRPQGVINRKKRKKKSLFRPLGQCKLPVKASQARLSAYPHYAGSPRSLPCPLVPPPILKSTSEVGPQKAVCMPIFVCFWPLIKKIGCLLAVCKWRYRAVVPLSGTRSSQGRRDSREWMMDELPCEHPRAGLSLN